MRFRALIVPTLIVLAPVLLAPVVALAADPRPLKVEDHFALKDVRDPRVSPDGKWVAYTVTSADLKKDTRDTDIYMAPVGGGEAIRLTSSDKAERAPRWSPDGKWLAFLSGRVGSHAQVWLLNRTGGEAVKLTDYKASVSDLAWSPDSTRLALIVSDVDPDDPGEEEKKADEDKTAKPIIVRRLQFKRDGQGYLNDLRSHVHVFDLATKSSRQLTSGSFDDRDPAWSPDSATIAFTSNRSLLDPDRTQNTDIYLVPASGGVPRPLLASDRAESNPVFSPDGTRVAFVSGGDPKDMWYGAGHIGVVPVSGGSPTPLTQSLDRNVSEPRFSPDGAHLYFLLEDGGVQPLARVPVKGGPVERVVDGEHEVLAFDIGPTGEIALLESSFAYPAEVWRAKDGALTRISRVNDEFLKGIELGAVQRFQAKSADGTTVHGFVTLPPGYKAGTKVPAILRIHGGPTSQFAVGFEFEWQIFAAQGYAVIAANPRGSTGYGTAFSRAIWADWGNKDTQDVLAAVDQVVAMGIADPDRLGVGGWSYGGILTDYVITKTTRFKAATSGASIANILAGYGTDHYQYEYEVELGLPWKARDAYLNISSSFMDVEKIVTPTLYLCGQLDMNVPLLNTEQLYQAVRRINKVPTELVIYPGQWHGIQKPSYRKDLYERYIAWYDRFLKPANHVRAGQAPEATSLLGTPLYAVELAPAAQAASDKNLAGARDEFVKSADSADAILWLGRQLAVAGRVREAIDVFTRGVEKFPADARFYRHRGHRYISVREFDKAVADLTKAGKLIAGKPDQPEPTTADRKVMSSETLNYATWYHLGLAHYLKGDFENALIAYRQCLAAAKGNDDQTVGVSDWLYMTLRRLGRRDEATKVLDAIVPNMKVKDDQTYYDRLNMYKGIYAPEDLLRAGGDPLTAATLAYGVGNWYLYEGRTDEAKVLFQRIVTGANWMPFGFIAAEAELARMR
ncbi:MAG TPA: prolyl oligopeptidase family serine peptidase [Vicinamibacterales bacterium]|nr:prolyl oligopeptidase family serine peptidase [Vicinamibacterales bacterium]